MRSSCSPQAQCAEMAGTVVCVRANHAERGRPSDYSTDIAMRICERLVAGERLGAICADAGMPAKATVCGWLTRNQEFRGPYA